MHQTPRLDPALSPAEALARLDADGRALVDAVRELYAGSWADAIEDLRRRRAGRPYLFRIDLSRTDELPLLMALHAYEQVHGAGSLTAVSEPVCTASASLP